MKRMISILLVLFALLAGCGAQGSEPTEYVSQLPEELEQYAIPWNVDAVELAKQDGSMHYYFMSAMGMITDPTHPNYPEKWGDSCLIVFPDGKTMLLDTGLDTYAQVLVENLRRLGVKQLDYVLLSHPHNDHCYGLWEEGGILDHFPIGIIFSNGAYNGKWTNKLMIEDICKEKNIPLQVLKQGDELAFGDVQARVLWPKPDIPGQTFTSGHDYDSVEDINNSSIVIRFDYKEHSSLFGGDIFSSAEAEILELYKEEKELLDVDLLKCLHHGSQTSNTAGFVMTAKPELAVSTGFAPIVKSVREAYTLANAFLLDDRSCGYIHVYSDGSGMQYEISGVH